MRADCAQAQMSQIVLLTPEEQAAKRAAQLKRLAALPEHLRLGVTLPGMRELLKQMPLGAVEQVNAKIPREESKRFGVFTWKGKPKFPKNETFNGYCYQYWFTKWAEEAKEGQPDGDGLAVCERLRKQGSPHVGEATVFVSRSLAAPIKSLLDALANFLKEKRLREKDTFFWVSDYVIRQTDVKTDLARLGECVSAVVGHTVLLMEPWEAPAPLTCAYCIKEVYHTQLSGAQFDVVMSSAQKAAFEKALVEDFKSIQASLSKVDVRTATCRKEEDHKAILDELERGVGFVACNTLVIGVLREALVAQGRLALARLPLAERATSVLLACLGMLLQVMGKLEEAMPLLEEALQGCRATLGDRHPHTLISLNNMGALLKEMGKLKEARTLYEEALQAQRETIGDCHANTLITINNMGVLLYHMGKLEEARPLFEEALRASRETLSDRHAKTLISINNMGRLLQAMSKLEEARPLLEEVLQGRRETLGDRHPSTLASIYNVGLLLEAMGELGEAEPLLEEALQGRKETLGDRHPDTLTSISNMGELERLLSI